MRPPRDLDSKQVDDLLAEASDQLIEDKRHKFRIVCLTTDLTWEQFLNEFRGVFSISEQGEFHEFHTTFEKHNQELDVYLYLYQYLDTGTPIFFTLNAHDDLRRTMRRVVTDAEGIYNLWLPPLEMAEQKEEILDTEGTRLTEFEYEKFGRERTYEEERRPESAREGSYAGDDAAHTLEEWKMEYGITPTQLTFTYPTKGDFQFSEDGEFVLERGQPRYLFEEVVVPAVEKVEGLNDTVRDSELTTVEEGGVEQIHKTELEITIPNSLDFDEADDFVEGMKDQGFYPYSYQVGQGSLLFDGRVVDESNGGMISVSSNGETVSLLPRYESGFDSLMRFYRFIVEEIDPAASVDPNV